MIYAFPTAWAKQWLVSFNPLKTEAVLLTLKLFETFPNLFFNDTEIKFVQDHKHLGLTLSSNEQWHTHIKTIIASATNGIGVMRKLKYTFHRIALSQTVQDCLALMQNEAARIVTGLTRSASLENLYRE